MFKPCSALHGLSFHARHTRVFGCVRLYRRFGYCFHGRSGKKNLLESADPSSAATARLQIKLSHDLHGISRVILMNHLDCGAYGGRAAFASDEEEYSRHAEDLRSAARRLSLSIHRLKSDL